MSLRNESAERACAAAVLMGGDLGPLLDLAPEDLTQPRARYLVQAGVQLARRQQPIEIPTLEAELRRIAVDTGTGWDAVGGLEGLNAAADDYRISRSVEAAVAEVRRAAKLRHVLQVAVELGNACKRDGADPDELCEKTSRRLHELDGSGVDEGLRSVRDVLHDAFEDLFARAKGEVNPISYGLRTLDEKMDGGCEPGELIVAGGRPGMGKTALGLKFALQEDEPAALFSLEMSAIQLGKRIIADRSNMASSRLKKPTMRDFEEARRCIAYLNRNPQLRIWTAGSKMTDIVRVARRWRRTLPKKAKPRIVLDYLQLAEHAGAESRERTVAECSRMAKLLALEVGAAVMLLAQLSRKVDDRPDKRPRMSDLRESGAIEQDADAILFVYRPHEHDKQANPTDAEIIIGKNRNGANNETAHVRFSPELTRFDDLENRFDESAY